MLSQKSQPLSSNATVRNSLPGLVCLLASLRDIHRSRSAISYVAVDLGADICKIILPLADRCSIWKYFPSEIVFLEKSHDICPRWHTVIFITQRTHILLLSRAPHNPSWSFLFQLGPAPAWSFCNPRGDPLGRSECRVGLRVCSVSSTYFVNGVARCAGSHISRSHSQSGVASACIIHYS